jgi:hypothetical protein
MDIEEIFKPHSRRGVLGYISKRGKYHPSPKPAICLRYPDEIG